MNVLAVDTCLWACSAALTRDGEPPARRVEPMSRGHQERLAPMVRELMTEAGVGFSALDRIGVTVGPGSFTGLRVGLAFAKGLGAALSLPVVGISALEALAYPFDGRVLAVLDAKRGQVYLQAFADGVAVSAPDVLPLDVAAARVAEFMPDTMVGTGAPLLAPVRAARIEPLDHADPVAVARLAAVKAPAPPRPLYLRPPDAKLPGGRSPPE